MVEFRRKDVIIFRVCPAIPSFFAKVVRIHWEVENEVHYCLDVTFGEDQNRSRTKYAAANLSILRKMTANIFRQEHSNKSLIQKQRKEAETLASF